MSWLSNLTNLCWCHQQEKKTYLMTENNHVFGVHFGVLFSISTENISAFALYLLRSSRTLKFIPFRIKKQILPYPWSFLVWCNATYFGIQNSQNTEKHSCGSFISIKMLSNFLVWYHSLFLMRTNKFANHKTIESCVFLADISLITFEQKPLLRFHEVFCIIVAIKH